MTILKKITLGLSIYTLGVLCAEAQSLDSLQKELAYYRKHPTEWKAYKATCLREKQNHAKHLDSIQANQDMKYKLQELYDDFAGRKEQADSLITLYEAKKNALLSAKKRQKHKLIFKIQIQMAQKHELDAFALPHTALTIEHVGKSKRYLVGKFRRYEEAEALVDVMRNGGASVYIVAYKNGERLADFSAYLD